MLSTRVLTADAWLELGSATPFTYGAGFAAYALATGLGFAAFTALILEVLRTGRRAAATGYALLFSSGNPPGAYMTWLDGAGYKRNGARGLMGDRRARECRRGRAVAVDCALLRPLLEAAGVACGSSGCRLAYRTQASLSTVFRG